MLDVPLWDEHERRLVERRTGSVEEGVSEHGPNAVHRTVRVFERVAFFVRRLAHGKHSLTYRLRAEIPGKFSALPTQTEAMYAPELKANADELKLQIRDQD